MRSIQELRAEEARVQRILDGGVEAELRAIPGVVHVSVGLKQINGTATDDIVIRVYVTEKKDPRAIPTNERIAARIQGVPTDVNQVKVLPAQDDTARYRPITGGIQISNGSGDGTLGCLATDNLDAKTVLLTNFHVIGGAPGVGVYQPTTALADLIGIVKRGLLDGIVDCAIADLQPGITTTSDEINNLVLNGSNHIAGIDFPVSGMHVQKVGRTSGLTVGKVVDGNAALTVTHPAPIGPMPFTKAILVQCTKISGCCCCTCNVVDSSQKFTLPGDSGSVYVTDERKVIGLHMSGGDGESYGCRIHEVQTRLNITINSTPVLPHVAAMPRDPVVLSAATASSSFAARTAAAGAPPSANDDSLWAMMQRRLDESPFGHEIGAQVRRHLPEAIDLVNHNRAVMVTWQRVKGPAFLAQWMNGIRNPSAMVPREIEGVTMNAALVRLAAVLKEFGGEDLRSAIDSHGVELMALLDRSPTVDALMQNLADAVAV